MDVSQIRDGPLRFWGRVGFFKYLLAILMLKHVRTCVRAFGYLRPYQSLDVYTCGTMEVALFLISHICNFIVFMLNTILTMNTISTDGVTLEVKH